MAMGRPWEDEFRPLPRLMSDSPKRELKRASVLANGTAGIAAARCGDSREPISPMARRFLSPLTGITAGRTIIAMLLVRITGNQLRAGRALAGLTIEDLAARAQLHRQSVRKWEGSSNAAVDAMVAHLSRALDVLEAEGIRFTDSGVQLLRPASMSTVIHSEGAAA
jgi:hypothetical protein